MTQAKTATMGVRMITHRESADMKNTELPWRSVKALVRSRNGESKMGTDGFVVTNPDDTG